ncbi:MAG: hypothetical protein V4544_06140 [Pseudomonadota bacterium]
MKYANMITSKISRPSRVFQKGMLQNLEFRFQELIQSSCMNVRQMRQHIYKSKVLLLDMRHILLYQSFDHDMRDKFMSRADAIVNYINAYMNAINSHEACMLAKQEVHAQVS